MKLSTKMRSVLEQLSVEDKFGFDLVAGAPSLLSRYSVYVLLARMEDKGLIAGFTVRAPSGFDRRCYAITVEGRAALEEQSEVSP